MTQVTVDDEMAAKLRDAKDIIEIVDRHGKTIAYLDSDADFERRIRKVPSPFTREEMEEHRKQTGGKSLAEVLAALRSQE